jgi:hypothetical protein
MAGVEYRKSQVFWKARSHRKFASNGKLTKWICEEKIASMVQRIGGVEHPSPFGLANKK